MPYGRAEPFGRPGPAAPTGPRIRAMESAAAMLIVLFQLFFGWCHEPGTGEPPAPQCQSDDGC